MCERKPLTRWAAHRTFVTLVVLGVLVACGNSPQDHAAALNDPSLNIRAEQVDGSGTLGLTLAGQPTTGVVVYFHGMDQRPDVTELSPKHRELLEPLLRSGHAVVSADADGNAFGNPASVQGYRDLMSAAQAKYGAAPVLFVAESMGALAALTLLAEDTRRQIKGLVGVTPLMGLPPDVRSVDFIAAPWGGRVPGSADPMSWSPERFDGRALRLYQADGDTVIPAGATAGDFAARFGARAGVEVVDCAGGHVAAACYDGAGVREWLSGLH